MSLATGDLTTLANAKVYIDSLPNDQILSALITRVSRWIHAELNRALLVPKTYTEQYDGTGTAQLVLPHWPLIGTPTVTISGTNIPIAPQAGPLSSPTSPFGFRVPSWNGLPPGNPAVLELVGYRFFQGRQNVVVSYSAGYQVTGEAQTVPSSSPYTVTPQTPYGIWATDQGVTANGVSLVATAGTPEPGQYAPPSPSGASPVLVYTFNAAQAGQALLLNYGFIPAELEQAAIELIAERASYRRRVGVHSQMLASQESMSYDLSGLPKYIVDMIYPYVSVLPPDMGASL